MKKTSKVLALAVAMLLIFSSMASAATIYFKNSSGVWVQADLNTLKTSAAMKVEYRKAQNAGRDIVIKNDDNSVVDWSKSAMTGVSYASASTSNTFTTTAPTASKYLKTDGTEGDVSGTPVKPAAPSVTRNDTANTVSGMAAGMEYKLDDTTAYVAYNATTFAALNFSGNHTLRVRVAAQGINPASDDTVLTFTDENKATLSVTASGATLTSGGLDVVNLTTTKVNTIMPGVNQVIVYLKSSQTTDGLTATCNGSAMTARSGKDGFYANIGAATSATVEITKAAVVPLDIVNTNLSKINIIMPGVNQVLVILKSGETTDGVTATANGIAMTARTAKDGFYANIGAATQATVIITKGASTQQVTIS